MRLNDKIKSRIRTGFGIAISAMLAVLGVLFICSCYSIYKSGASPFTRESIGAAFSRIAIPTYLTVTAVILGAAFGIVFPEQEGRLRGLRTPEVVTAALARRVDLTAIDIEKSGKIEKERTLRARLRTVRTVLLVASAILPLFYLLNPFNFPAVSGEYNAEILHGMLLYLLFLAPCTVYEVAYVILRDRSLAREGALLSEAIKEHGASKPEEQRKECPLCRAADYIVENKTPIVLGVRIALVGCAVVFIILGVLNGGMSDVLNKAIKICTECIGLG